MKNFTYKGAKTNEISFPLGGIGTGCIGLSGNGRLIDWEIFNKPNKGSDGELSHFAIKAEVDGRVLDARVLNGDLHPPYSGVLNRSMYQGFGWGPQIATMAGVPHFKEVIYLQKLNIPLVTICNRVEGEFPFVGIDDYRAMKEATLHAVQKGYQRIIYVSPPLSFGNDMNIYSQEQRLKGCLDALDEINGLEPVIISERNFLSGLDAINLKDPLRTAVLCSSDIYALEILRHLEARGISVPADAGLMGFDNIDMLRYVKPSIATVSYPFEELGVKALDLLLKQMQGDDDTVDRLLEHTILDGDSL